MSDELFEVAFSGQISAGENVDDVKARVAKMFNADAAKLAQLFSGNRVVIKKNADQATAQKYQAALNKAGAECEIRSSLATAESPVPTASAPAEVAAPPVAAPVASRPASTQASGDLTPPNTDPLGITGDQIEDLAVDIAPVGSVLQTEVKAVDAPQFDLSEFDVAPVGSELSTPKKEPDPAPPDTSGLSMAD